jgi:hypothetical protein
MGFNKRFITEDSLKQIYNRDGYKLLVDNITKPDALFISDDFSERIVDAVREGASEDEIKKLMGENGN